MIRHNSCAKLSADVLWFFHRNVKARTCGWLLAIEAGFSLLAWLVSSTAGEPMTLSAAFLGRSSMGSSFLIDILAINICAILVALTALVLHILAMFVKQVWMYTRVCYLLSRRSIGHAIKNYRINVHDAYEQKKYANEKQK